MTAGVLIAWWPLQSRSVNGRTFHTAYRIKCPLQAKDETDGAIFAFGKCRIHSRTAKLLEPQGQHLTCCAGRMIGLGARRLDRFEDIVIARRFVNGCIWAYGSMPIIILPEICHINPCHGTNNTISRNQTKWASEVLLRNRRASRRLTSIFLMMSAYVRKHRGLQLSGAFQLLMIAAFCLDLTPFSRSLCFGS